MTTGSWRLLIAGAALAAAGTAAPTLAGGPASVGTCGQVVTAKYAILVGDLDCSTTDGPAVDFAQGGRLDLAGHTLTAKDIGVRCLDGTCKIVGPGTIRRFEPVQPPNAGTIGVSAVRSAKVLAGVTVEGWGVNVFALQTAEVRDGVLRDGAFGVVGGPVRIRDVSVTNHWVVGVQSASRTPDGIKYYFDRTEILRGTFSGNAIDIASYRLPRVRDTTCTTSRHQTIPATPWGGGDDWGVCP